MLQTSGRTYRLQRPNAQKRRYPNRMAKSKKFDLENPAPVVDDEDEETLAARRH